MLIYSPNSFESNWAKKEYRTALMSDPVNQGLKLLPLMAQKTEVAPELIDLKWLDATSPVKLETAVRKVLEALL